MLPVKLVNSKNNLTSKNSPSKVKLVFAMIKYHRKNIKNKYFYAISFTRDNIEIK